jgi:hypothetical protein
MNAEPTPADRYQTIIIEMLRQIIKRLDDLDRNFDEIDRTVLRPFGDGTRLRRRA